MSSKYSEIRRLLNNKGFYHSQLRIAHCNVSRVIFFIFGTPPFHSYFGSGAIWPHSALSHFSPFQPFSAISAISAIFSYFQLFSAISAIFSYSSYFQLFSKICSGAAIAMRTSTTVGFVANSKILLKKKPEWKIACRR